MSLFENITKKVTDTAKAAAKKSGELVEVTKLNMSISAEREKIEKAYAEMGKLVYESFVGGEEIKETFKDTCEKIKSFEENIKDTKEKILELKAVKICTSCGEELDEGVAFCSKCGAKQEIPQPVVAVEESATDKTCPDCGALSPLDSAFCTKCGTRLG